ncbi:hypothetical protein BC936DRAFT_148560, partial [Jimgerdemannia flammicorona]
MLPSSPSTRPPPPTSTRGTPSSRPTLRNLIRTRTVCVRGCCTGNIRRWRSKETRSWKGMVC